MGDVALPESVKIARVGFSLGTAIEGERFPIHLGDNEVAILLSIYYCWYTMATAGYNVMQVGLWRKTDTNPPAMESDHTDMIWEWTDARQFAAATSMQFSGQDHIILPWPLILIRAPRLVGLRMNVTTAYINMRLYYLVQKISDEKLAELMVKDHA